MVAVDVGLPDWRDASAYRFDRLDRPGFAWEWLRRDPVYRAAALAAFGGGPPAMCDPVGAARWGLVAFENPMLASPEARPLWRAEHDASVLLAQAVAGEPDDRDTLALHQIADIATLVHKSGIDHWLLSDGCRRVRFDLRPEWPDAVPRRLYWHVEGLASAAPKILALRRLLSVIQTGNFADRLWPRDPRARRWALALRAHDALTAGHGQRTIAGLLVGVDLAVPRWRVRNPSVRLQAQRLATLARTLEGRGFADRFLGRP
jgi:hypothetical protein